ncbi:MAG: GNAT family N-acetyltransferase [Turicibacter sp.]|nr:GNAT family N-acetyltransferase [Turicibacter sp.]
MAVEIRECMETDSKAVYGLLCELEDDILDSPNFEKIFRDKLDSPRNHLVIAESNGAPTGFLHVSTDFHLHHAAKIATLEELVVTQNIRNLGIGKALLASAVEYAKAEGCILIELTSSFHRVRAHEFYMKNGFEKRSFKLLMDLEVG